jgi:hypothetical protein
VIRDWYSAQASASGPKVATSMNIGGWPFWSLTATRRFGDLAVVVELL